MLKRVGEIATHWEAQNRKACDVCVRTEHHVTHHVANSMRFRVVRIDDQDRRNHFEARLIATMARCSVCAPSQKLAGSLLLPARRRIFGPVEPTTHCRTADHRR